jgi:energy-converting hydrogenase A subunit M
LYTKPPRSRRAALAEMASEGAVFDVLANKEDCFIFLIVHAEAEKTRQGLYRK